MKEGRIRIAGAGCSLADFLFNGVSFSSPKFLSYVSRAAGDGGLSPGRLVFTEELEQFAGKNFNEIYRDLLDGREPDAFNIGGPSIVALIHVAQMLDPEKFSVEFHGMAGNDRIAERIIEIAARTPLNIQHYLNGSPKATPFTYVLSDPQYDGGHGERTFINNIGAAWDFHPEDLPVDFFTADLVCFGGTGLVPHLHDHLTGLLRRVKENGGLTVVNTVYDFRNEKKNPGKPWPLVDPGQYGLVDMLIMDATEALSISGCKTLGDASAYFIDSGVGAFIITNGAKDLVGWSGGGWFESSGLQYYPVSSKITDQIRTAPETLGDTTGCGDNFAGGVIASMAWQMEKESPANRDLREAVAWGVASGGFCCFTVGGTWIEDAPGRKYQEIKRIYEQYLSQ
jgi:sugar/nucleoside kinase (ribokinase family)